MRDFADADLAPIPVAPQWEGDHFPDADWEECQLCGRPVRLDRPHWRIIHDPSCSYMVARSAFDAAPEKAKQAMGTYVVGPHCRKRIDKRFLLRVKVTNG